jgi:hypothetical protein
MSAQILCPWKWLSKELDEDLTDKPFIECNKEQIDFFNQSLSLISFSKNKVAQKESLRDLFAALAIPHYLANTTDRDAVNAGMEIEEMVAVQAYMMADAMMAERGNK